MGDTIADIHKRYGETVYPYYKAQSHEPYMENDSGHGYKGEILYDELEDKVQCSECGKWFSALQSHVKAKHNLSLDSYRCKYDLPEKAAINSISLSSKASIEMKKKRQLGLIKSNMEIKNSNIAKRNKSVARTKNSMYFKNKFGLCNAQIATRLVIVRDMAEKERVVDITSAELERYDHELWNSLRTKYGNVENACAKLGIKFTNGAKYDETKSISLLRRFVIKYKFIPVAKDLYKYKDELCNRSVFERLFGSWRRAKMMAGLGQLLQEVKQK